MQPIPKPNIEKAYEVFGKEKGAEILAEEYHELSKAELEITKLRWTVYTAFVAVSLALSGYVWATPTVDPALTKIGLAFGAFVHVAAYYFYWWFHRLAIMYREYLKVLEQELGFARYSIRLDRPRIGPVTLRFHWGIALLLLAQVTGTVVYILVA